MVPKKTYNSTKNDTKQETGDHMDGSSNLEISTSSLTLPLSSSSAYAEFLSHTPSEEPSTTPTELGVLSPSSSQSFSPISIFPNQPSVLLSNPQSRIQSMQPTVISSFNQPEIIPSQSSVAISKSFAGNPSIKPFSAPSYDSFTNSSIASSLIHGLSPIPSITSSIRPTLKPSIHPTTNSSSSFNLSDSISSKIQVIEILPFTMLLLSNSTGLDREKILHLSITHMTDTFQLAIPSYFHFENLNLNVTERIGRHRKDHENNINYVFDYSGKAYFRTIRDIDGNFVHQARMKAFDSYGMETFLLSLTNSDINVKNAFMVKTGTTSTSSRENTNISSNNDMRNEPNDSGKEKLNAIYYLRISARSCAYVALTFGILAFLYLRVWKNSEKQDTDNSKSSNIITAVAVNDDDVSSSKFLKNTKYDDEVSFETNFTIYRIEEASHECSMDDASTNLQSIATSVHSRSIRSFSKATSVRSISISGNSSISGSSVSTPNNHSSIPDINNSPPNLENGCHSSDSASLKSNDSNLC